MLPHILGVLRLHPSFDIHDSNKLDTENTCTIVTSDEHSQEGKSFDVRLHFYRLGWWRVGVMRMVGKKWRRLWIGPLPFSPKSPNEISGGDER